MKFNNSVSRAIDIINLLSESDKPMTMAEISRDLNIPKTCTFEILYTMVDKDYLEIADDRLKTFKLGIKLFQAGARYLDKTDLHREARPLLEKMMVETGDTVFLVVEDKGQLVYLDKVEGSSSVRTTANLGSRNPMHCTGVGKALLAAYPEERVREIINIHQMKKMTEYTITNYDDLLLDLENIRERGYSIDNRESELELLCVAAPIYNNLNKPIAAISIAGIYSKINSERLESNGKLVTEFASKISKRLGFGGDKLFI